MIQDIFYLVHNRKRTIDENFPKLRETVGKKYRLWVIDNGSTIQGIPKSVLASDHYFKFKKNVGIAGAINKMTELAKGKYFIYVESDCLVHDGWLKEIEKEVNAHKRKLAWMGFKAINKDGSMAFFYRNMDDEGNSLQLPSEDEKDISNSGVHKVDAPCNVLSVFSIKALKDIGGVNTDLISQWIDADLGMRFKTKNWNCIANANITFIHTSNHKESYQDRLDHDLFKSIWTKKVTACKICGVKLDKIAMKTMSGTICMTCFKDINDASMQPNQFAPNVYWTLAETFFRKGKGEKVNFKELWETSCEINLVELDNLQKRCKK